MEKIILKAEKQQKAIWSWGTALFLIVLLIAGLALFLIIDGSEGKYILGGLFFISAIILLGVLCWIPAFFRSLEYTIEDESINGKKGVFWQKTTSIPYFKITNVDVTQSPVERAFGIGKIHCQTAGVAGPQGQRAELKLVGIKNLEAVKNTILDRIAAVRKSMKT
jgi:hypothetical protein